jgi:hypothetical protein
MSNTKANLHHFLQLRLAKDTVAAIDDAISATPQMAGFNRCKFIRYAVLYALASISAQPDGNSAERS